THRSGPESASRVEVEMVDSSWSEPIDFCIRTGLAIVEVCEPPLHKSKPNTAAGRISKHHRGEILSPKTRPGEPFDEFPLTQMQETVQDRADPKILAVAGDRPRKSARYATSRTKSALFEAVNTGGRRCPNPPAIVLKQRLDGVG